MSPQAKLRKAQRERAENKLKETKHSGTIIGEWLAGYAAAVELEAEPLAKAIIEYPCDHSERDANCGLCVALKKYEVEQTTTWFCTKCSVEVPKGERCKFCGKTKREKI